MGFGRDLMVMTGNVVMGFCRVFRFRGFCGVSKGFVWKFRGFSLENRYRTVQEDLEGFCRAFVMLKGFSGILNGLTQWNF